MRNDRNKGVTEMATAELVSYDPIANLIEAAAKTNARVTITIDINPLDPEFTSEETTDRTYRRGANPPQ